MRLRRLPRYLECTTTLLGQPLVVPDAASFLAMYDEIFVRGFYRFASPTDAPFVIDCGANIGLSALFFKQLYPHARVLAFEPDPKIYLYLLHTLRAFGIDDVEANNSAVWCTAGPLRFESDGADSGKVVSPSQRNAIEVPAVRLRDYLTGSVGMLKIDIEGAETTVLEDCRDSLNCVQNIFVEYHSFAGRPQTLSQVLSILTNAGFRLRLECTGLPPSPLVNRAVRHGMDMRVNIFGFREGDGEPRV